ncbi:MAG: hypothetical protein M0010_18815 [Actinomycetota bacterium]|nr:hypothetical protein [Actinomycetota bacterium]
MLREGRVVITVRYTADREPSPEQWAWHADVGGQRVEAERCEPERPEVYVVVTADSEDPVFAFAREADAAAFAATYGALDATDYGATPVIGPELAAEMIAEREEPTALEQSA